MSILPCPGGDHLHQMEDSGGPLFAGVRFPPGYEVYWHDDLPDGVVAATRWSDKTVWVRNDLSGLYLRFVLEHERQHTLRGPAADRGLGIYEEERECDWAAAEAMWAEGLLVDVEWLGYVTRGEPEWMQQAYEG